MPHTTSNENPEQPNSTAPAASENPAESVQTTETASQPTVGADIDPFTEWATNKSSALGEMQKDLQSLRAKMTEERRRIKHERDNRKEHVRVLFILGKIIARGGKERVEQALGKAPWLAEKERQIVEYHYELRPRPAVTRQKATEGH